MATAESIVATPNLTANQPQLLHRLTVDPSIKLPKTRTEAGYETWTEHEEFRRIFHFPEDETLIQGL
jgi:hypothetical protein